MKQQIRPFYHYFLGTLTHFYFYKHNVFGAAATAGLTSANVFLQIWRPNGRWEKARNLTLVWVEGVEVDIGKNAGELYQVGRVQ